MSRKAVIPAIDLSRRARYVCWLSYYGSSFHGSQSQPKRATVQGVLDQALAMVGSFFFWGMAGALLDSNLIKKVETII